MGFIYYGGVWIAIISLPFGLLLFTCLNHQSPHHHHHPPISIQQPLHNHHHHHFRWHRSKAQLLTTIIPLRRRRRRRLPSPPTHSNPQTRLQCRCDLQVKRTGDTNNGPTTKRTQQIPTQQATHHLKLRQNNPARSLPRKKAGSRRYSSTSRKNHAPCKRLPKETLTQPPARAPAKPT